jgi:hypothetical protein
MATTTNFGWTTPNDTDLVKDGAAAIRTLGQAIDTSLMDLEGGTTGQVLKKNSNTDMDFIWAADSAGMTNPLTTTGDTIYSSSGTTPARLGIGSTGQVLTVAAGIPSWATPAGAAFVGCLATISGSQTISNATQTKKTFTGTDVFDTDGFHDPASNDTRITIPAGKDGYYLIYAQVTWDASSAGRRIIYLTKNNTSTLRLAEGFSTATNTVYPALSILTVANLVAGDYIETEIFQSSGGNLNTDAGSGAHQFGVVKLG